MEPTSIMIIVGLVTLIIERIFDWSLKIKKSTCCGLVNIEMKDNNN